MGQPGFYSLTWAHKVRFPGSEVSSNPKKKKKVLKQGENSSERLHRRGVRVFVMTMDA
jgi:hypothetical protein